MKEAEWVAFCAEQYISTDFDDYDSTPPIYVKPVPRFFECPDALKSLFNVKLPPSITVRTSLVTFVIYGFADASKSGFGASLQMEKGVRYRIGTWSKDYDDESSNFREFENVVITLEEQSKDGSINHTTLIMATGNSTVESAIFKGNSSSPKLFDLVVRFKRLELHTGSRFLVTHVSGERIKAQGTDGLSRGKLREGVSLGLVMNTFCPWGKSPLQRSPDLEPWLRSWIGQDLEVLTPSQWFTRGHDHLSRYRDSGGFWRIKTKPGRYLWQPSPAAVDAMMEENRKAALKEQNPLTYFTPTFVHTFMAETSLKSL